MRIGIPRELQDQEVRVGCLPAGVAVLTRAGHQVLVEAGAGEGAGIGDREYAAAGATLVSAGDLWADAGLVVKVKAPVPAEYPRLRPGQVILSYLQRGAFREAFDRKGRLHTLVERLPAYVVTNAHPGLLGAARIASG